MNDWTEWFAKVALGSCLALSLASQARAAEPAPCPATVVTALTSSDAAATGTLRKYVGSSDAKAHPDVAVAALAVLWTKDPKAAGKSYRGNAAFYSAQQRKIADARGVVPDACLAKEDLQRIGDAVLPVFEGAVKAGRLDEAMPAGPFVTLYTRYMCMQANDCARSKETFQVVNEAVEKAQKRPATQKAGVGSAGKKPGHPPSAFDLGDECTGDPNCR